MKPGASALHLIPVPLGPGAARDDLPESTLAAARALDYFIVENEKSARRFLGEIAHPRSIQHLRLERFDKDSGRERARQLLQPVLGGCSAGVLSEAGCPGIADPGALLVELAHEQRLRVVPHVGPASVLLALMASGFNGQCFAFHGYLPVAKPACRREITRLERASRASGATQIFIETPYRSDALLASLLETCEGKTRLCIASDLTLATESVVSASAAELKQKGAAIGRRPTVFLLSAR